MKKQNVSLQEAYPMASQDACAARRHLTWVVRLRARLVREKLKVEYRRAEWLRRRARFLVKSISAMDALPPPRKSARATTRGHRRLRLVSKRAR